MEPVRRIAVALLVLAGFGAVALLAIGLYPADLPVKQDPTFIDTVFDNRGVVWMARLLLVSAAGVLAFGGIFIVASIGIRMKNGEWLRRAGPFEVAEKDMGGVEGQAEYWRQRAIATHERAEVLAECLRKSNDLLRQV
jgi:hypothetical protein